MPADDRVLLLDIRAAERSRLAASISRLGYMVLLAEDLATAQALREREAVPIMIVSMRDQPAQIAELRTQMPGSAIITIGTRAVAAALAAWHAGADGYLPRPVRQNELAHVLEHVLRARAADPAKVPAERSTLAELRRMAAELAHQINAPLTPILALADLLADELPLNHPGREYAQTIAEAALRIRDVTWMLEDMAQQKG